MGTVAIITTPGGGAVEGARPAHPKAVIRSSSGSTFTFPFLPRDATYSGGYPTYAVLPRPRRKDLLQRASTSLRTIELTCLLAHRDPQASVEPWLTALGKVLRSGEVVTLTHAGPALSGRRFRVLDASTASTALQHGTNEMTSAVVTISLSEDSDDVVRIGPLSGGKSTGKKHPRATTYTVKKGDTLRRLADRFYGTPSKWRLIADAQKPKIKSATVALKVGRKLRIPAG